MRILGLDPATRCGWALLDSGARVASGYWDLSRGEPAQRPGMRYARLAEALADTLDLAGADLVAYEHAQFAHGPAGWQTAHLHGGLCAVIMLVCEQRQVRYLAVPVPAVKRAATGKGNAKKPAMVEAARRRWGVEAGEDEADALWVAVAAAN